jgi:hypothetical protein
MVGIMQMNRRGIFAAAALAAISLLTGCEEVSIKTEAKAIVEDARTPTWSIATLASAGDAGSYSSLALYGNEPRIAYYLITGTPSTNGTYYIKHSASGWGAAEQVIDGDVGKHVALDVNASDIPFIAAENNRTSYHLGYFVKPSSSWYQILGLYPIGALLDGISICADFVTDMVYPENGVLLAFGWATTPGTDDKISLRRGGVVHDVITGEHSGIMVAESASLQDFVYINTNIAPHNLRTASYPAGATSQIPGDAYPAGYEVTSYSFIMDPTLNRHVAFATASSTCYSTATSAAPTTWSSAETIVNHPVVAIKLGALPDGAGGYRPCIVFQDGSPKHLYFAYRTGTAAWTIETIDDSTEVISDLSLTVDGLGRAHVSYYDYTNKDLRYARRKAF